MTQPAQVTLPAATDAPTLTLAAATLLANEFPQVMTTMTPDRRLEVGVQAVDMVMALWDEIQKRIATGVLLTPTE